jgi:hypothetical protein
MLANDGELLREIREAVQENEYSRGTRAVRQ